jgi:FkbM family methyltransferase
MFVDTNDVGLSTHLLLEGYWEMWLTEVLTAVIRPGLVAVDIGANLGYFTMLMADLVGASGQVHAFEPNPAIAARLEKSIDVNGFRDRTTVHRDPLGSLDGAPVILAVPDGEPKNAHLTGDPNALGAIHLTSRRFDSYPELMAADVIKIDAEAAELDIWRGMTGFFEQKTGPVTIFLEFASVRYPDPEAFLKDIEGQGFRLAVVDLVKGVLPRTRTQILADPPAVDQMLMLTR